MANNHDIKEENEDEDDNDEDNENGMKKRRDSENYQMPVLDDIEHAKLLSCIDEIRSVVGDTISERQIVETAMKYEYDVEKTLNAILNTNSNSSPSQKTIATASSSTSAIKDVNITTKSLKNISIGSEKGELFTLNNAIEYI